MPTSEQPRSAAPDHAVRRQLDELDALMQRMLALPVGSQEESATDALAAKIPMTAESAEPTASRSAPKLLSLREVTTVNEGPAPAAEKLAMGEQSVSVLPSLPSEFGADKGTDRVQSMPACEQPLIAWWLLPFFWTNQVFDRCVGWMGPPGRWLRSLQGRTLLGCIGLFLLAGALAWFVLDGIDWTW